MYTKKELDIKTEPFDEAFDEIERKMKELEEWGKMKEEDREKRIQKVSLSTLMCKLYIF